MTVFPWRKPGEKSYIVDFAHSWDYYFGHPGWVARDDEARARLYRELGFKQTLAAGVERLPFV